MPFCPKCEDEYRAGIAVCADCGVELVEALKTPTGDEEHEHRWAEEQFEDERDLAHVCPNCWTEFVSAHATCPPCGGVRVARLTRASYEKLVGQSQLEPFRPRTPAAGTEDLVRVTAIRDHAEAGFVAESLSGMGVPVVLGDDLMDRDLDDDEIGVWVRRDDLESAGMLLPEAAEEDALQVRDVDPYRKLTRAADAYGDLGRARHAIALCVEAIDLDGRRPEAFLTMGRVLGRRGDVEHAVKAFHEAAERMGRRERGAAYFLAAVHGYLTPEGEAAFRGSRADVATQDLERHLEPGTRNMAALLLALESAVARRDEKAGRSALERIRGVNAQVLKMPGQPSELARKVAPAS